jgi:hypothetical protein
MTIYINSLLNYRSKISLIKFANSIYLAQNIYVLNRRIAFVTYYNKSRLRHITTKYIVCYLFNTLSQVLTQYLVYICLFTRNLSYDVSEYLFVNKRGLWAKAELTIRLAKATALHLGVRLLVSK